MTPLLLLIQSILKMGEKSLGKQFAFRTDNIYKARLEVSEGFTDLRIFQWLRFEDSSQEISIVKDFTLIPRCIIVLFRKIGFLYINLQN